MRKKTSMKTILKYLICLILTLKYNFILSDLMAWEKIKDCDFGKFIIEKNEKEYQLIMKGGALDHFVKDGILPPLSSTLINKTFKTSLYLEDGEYRFDIREILHQKISFHIYDYGNITIIAKNENNTELAFWNYRNCQ